MQGKIPAVAVVALAVFGAGCSQTSNPLDLAQFPAPTAPSVAVQPMSSGAVAVVPAPRPEPVKASPKAEVRRNPATSLKPSPTVESSNTDDGLPDDVRSRVRQSVVDTVEEMNRPAVNQVDQQSPAPGKVVRPAGGVPPLDLQGSGWEDGKEGFTYHAGVARRHFSEGRPDLARRAANAASQAASTPVEVAEANALLSAADVFFGREGSSVTAGIGASPSDGWLVLEAARSGIAGERYEMGRVVPEVASWPSPAAVLVLPYLAAAAQTDGPAAKRLAEQASALAASGAAEAIVVELVHGYSARAEGRSEDARTHFLRAATMRPKQVSLVARARVEALKDGVDAGVLDDEAVRREAGDAALARTGDDVERRALRYAADVSAGAEKVTHLRRLESLLPMGAERTAVSAELDLAVAEASRPAVETLPDERTEVQSPADDAAWLLEPNDAPVAEEGPRQRDGKLDAAEAAIDRADTLIEEFERQSSAP